MSDDYSEAETALLELGRSFVNELAGGRLLELMLASQPEHSDAGRRLANVRWAKGPGEAIGGRKVLQVLSHPQSPTVLYDLGDGHFAEGERGKAPGTVLRSDQFNVKDLQDKGWGVEPADTSGQPAGGSGTPAPTPSQTGSSSGVDVDPLNGARSQRIPRRSTQLGAGDRALAARKSTDAVTKALMEGTATDEHGTLDGHGQIWHPDRASVHNEIIANHLDAATTVPSSGKAILTGGLDRAHQLQGAGAWKEGQYAPVCVHEIAQELAKAGIAPEVAGVHPNHGSVLVHREAAHVASILASALAARRKNMAICGSMTDPEHVRTQVGRLRNAGYSEIRGAHLSTPVDKAVSSARAAGLPASAVLASALSHGDDKASRGFEAAKEHLDGWEKWDHSGDTPTRVARGGRPARPAGIVHSVEDLASGR